MIIRSIITISLVLVTIAEDVSDNNIIDKNTESSLQKRTGGHHHGTGKVCQYLEQNMCNAHILGTSCVVKGSYCQCHYCKCEKGQLHCSKKGLGGHKVITRYTILSLKNILIYDLFSEFWKEVLLWQHGGRILPL